MTRVPALGPRGEGWLALQVVLMGLTALAGLASLTGPAGPAWEGTLRLAVSIVGIVLIGGGGLLAVRGLLDLGDGLTAFPRPIPGAPLVETGAYRLVRHPIYSGIILGALGWGLATAAPLALVGALALFILFDLKSRREEAWLLERHPAYAEYRRRTRKLIPGVY